MSSAARATTPSSHRSAYSLKKRQLPVRNLPRIPVLSATRSSGNWVTPLSTEAFSGSHLVVGTPGNADAGAAICRELQEKYMLTFLAGDIVPTLSAARRETRSRIPPDPARFHPAVRDPFCRYHRTGRDDVWRGHARRHVPPSRVCRRACKGNRDRLSRPFRRGDCTG